MSDITLNQAQRMVEDWIREYGVRYFSELTNLGQLMEEVGELSRLITRTYGDQSFKEGEKKTGLGDELADILFVLVCISNQTGVDLERAFKRNIAKKTERDGQRHRDNEKLNE